MKPFKKIGHFMENIAKWIEDQLAAIASIATGDGDDQETKDQVAALNTSVTELTTQLRTNGADDAGQKEAQDALQKIVEALTAKLAAAPPPDNA